MNDIVCTTYRIVGNFRGVENFNFFAPDGLSSAKLNADLPLPPNRIAAKSAVHAVAWSAA